MIFQVEKSGKSDETLYEILQEELMVNDQMFKSLSYLI
jgi:hypothetical protein